MAASRLSDAQKQELVRRWRAGESSAALADGFGCSPNTVTRVVKGALPPELYDQLKKERGRPVAQLALATDPPLEAVKEELVDPPQLEALAPEPDAAALEAPDPDEGVNDVDDVDDEGGGRGVLAIDDADDFGDDIDEESDGDDTDDEGNVFTTVPVVSGLGVDPQERPAVVCQPLETAPLPASLYMLVDKTVELQARPLSDFPELGALPDDEQARQALVVFANPRQAKRQCGRTQRVIKVPDSQVIHRTATYLVGQGITRVVLEGALYALPES